MHKSRPVSALFCIAILLWSETSALWSLPRTALRPPGPGASLQPWKPAADLPPAEPAASALIGPEGGTLRLGKAGVEIPPGALSADTFISICGLSEIQSLGDGLSNATDRAAGFRFEPHGLRFLRPVRIRLPFDRSLLGSRAALENLCSYFYNEESRCWEKLERLALDSGACIIESAALHFTDMVNAVLKLPQSPEVPSFNANSIKNLEAANPCAGIPLPEGPQAGSSGANNFSLSLHLPPGRGGAAPKLSLSYSSDGGNGWLGRGFDIAVPQISIDTRFGTPRYSGADQYSLEGEELLPDGTAEPRCFHPRADRDFARIRWHRAAGPGGEDYWEVEEKDGSLREYGRGSAWAGAARDRTFIWYISRTRDSFGNTVKYTYDKIDGFTYLNTIEYSGHEDSSGREDCAGIYQIRFVRETMPRRDPRLDLRGGWVSRDGYRLAAVEVCCRGLAVRRYRFAYSYNEFGASELDAFSEENAAGEEFYTYRFSYFGLENRAGSDGCAVYDAFGPSTETWLLQDQRLRGLGGTESLSLGADFSFSVSIGFGAFQFGSLGVVAGLGTNTSWSTGSLLDANGDGLPDYAWSEGGNLRVYLNEGGEARAFNTSVPAIFGGLGAQLDREKQNTAKIGGSAAAGGCSGSATWQESHSEARTMLLDLDGDGFGDLLNLDDPGHFRKGSAAGFERRGLELGGGAPAAARSGARPQNDYLKSYYIEEPVLAWESPLDAGISLTSEASLESTERRGPLAVRIYAESAEEAALVLNQNGSTRARTALGCSVARGGRLYFHEDCFGEEENSAVKLCVSIKYDEAQILKRLLDVADYCPFPELPKKPDEALEKLYSYSRIAKKWVLKEDWVQQTDRNSLARLLIENRFVPRRIPAALFEKIYAAASAEGSGSELSCYDRRSGQTSTAPANPRAVLLLGYSYSPSRGAYLRTGWECAPGQIQYADETIMPLLGALSGAEKEECAGARAWDGGPLVQPGRAGCAASYNSSGNALCRAAMLDAAEGAQTGDLVKGRGILLGRFADPLSAVEKLVWLSEDRKSISLEIPAESKFSPIERAEIRSSDGAGRFRYTVDGIECTDLFGTMVPPSELPESDYIERLGGAALRGILFSPDSYYLLPPSVWAMAAKSEQPVWNGQSPDPGDPVFISSYVEMPDGNHALASENLSTQDRMHILKKLKSLDGGREIFSLLPGEDSFRVISIDEAQYADLRVLEGPEAASLFMPCSVLGNTVYYIPYELIKTRGAEVERMMKAYMRDRVQLCGAYTSSSGGGRRLYNAGTLSVEQKSKIAGFARDAGLDLPYVICKTVGCMSSTRFRAVQMPLPAGASVELDGADPEEAAAVPGEIVSAFYLPEITADGSPGFRTLYWRNPDSLRGFSGADRAGAPRGRCVREECLGGGSAGWYYGVWSGYYPWNSAKLGCPGAAPRNGGSGTGEISEPCYSSAMSPNRDSQGSAIISLSGADRKIEVPLDAMIGKVSFFDVADETGGLVHYQFAAFIGPGGLICASRNGGSSYRELCAPANPAFGLAALRLSHSAGWDFGAGAGSGSLSFNTSRCWQYETLIDMNGDRYPDIVRLADTESGSQELQIQYGNGCGFSGSGIWRCQNPMLLSRSHTESYGFGLSAGGSTGLNIVKKSNGRTMYVGVEKAEDGSGGNLAASASFSGSLAITAQTEGLFDMNGDGLPDEVKRDGIGGFSVSLNLGDGAFAPPRDWGSGIQEEKASEGISGVFEASAMEGISWSTSGSFGATSGLNMNLGIFSVNASGGFNGTSSKTVSTLMDINGDGLPDVVAKRDGESYFMARLNLGDHFAEQGIKLLAPAWRSLERFRALTLADIAALSGGLLDLRFDGLALSQPPQPDSEPGQCRSQNRFASECDPFSIMDTLEYSNGLSFNLGASGSASIRMGLFTFSLGLGVNGCHASSCSSIRFCDIDGDGLPDHIFAPGAGGELEVRINHLGKVGLLKKIFFPMGGSCCFEYSRSGNTPLMPQSRWVLSACVRDPGPLPADRGCSALREEYAYSEGFYDRGERLFYGFGLVETRKGSASKPEEISIVSVKYNNRDYYLRSTEAVENIYGIDSAGRRILYSSSIQEYGAALVQRQSRARGWGPAEGADRKSPRLLCVRSRLYEAGTERCAETAQYYDSYDEYGNVTALRDVYSDSAGLEELCVHVEYGRDIGPGCYLAAMPELIEARGRSGLLRKRTGSYGPHGELTVLRDYYSGSGFYEHRIGYDEDGRDGPAFGNLTSIRSAGGCRRSWIYDEEAHQYAVKYLEDNEKGGSSAYSSSIKYSLELGLKISETDPNGKTMRFGYDSFGRLAELWSPYDTGRMPAVRYSYMRGGAGPGGFWSALSENKIRFSPDDSSSLRTILTVDGLGRLIQSAKQGEIRSAEGLRETGWNLSGAKAYDSQGRAVSEGQPRFANTAAELPPLAPLYKPTRFCFDSLSRETCRTLPDGNSMHSAYHIESGLAIETSIDPLGGSTRRVLDGKGNIIGLSRLGPDGRTLMSESCSYNEMGEIISAEDSQGNAVKAAYNLAGDRTSLESPDTGKSEYFYNESGMMSSRTDPNLRAMGGEIRYRYDGLERLVRVEYPRTSPTEYLYGGDTEACRAKGQVGRISARKDSSGQIDYEYGALGETAGISRTLYRINGTDTPACAEFRYRSNYLGQLEQIVYPDGEILEYSYNEGGQIQSARGSSPNGAIEYVKNITYDEFGQRSSIDYGNGTRTSYRYDEDRRWLNGIRTAGPGGEILQNIEYRFDPVGNVLGYTNDSGSYSTSQSYSYSANYELLSANGNSIYRPFGRTDYASSYSQHFSYDPIGNMLEKTSSLETRPEMKVGSELSYTNNYHYYTGKAHQTEQIGNIFYRYDLNGNIIEEREGGHGTGKVTAGTVVKQGSVYMTDTGFGIVRRSGTTDTGSVYARYYAWDEENRLVRSVDGRIAVDYRYDADGKRTAKCSALGEELYFDSMWQLERYSSGFRQLKNIYIGETRIASQIGFDCAGTQYKKENTYYYHSDHLGSAQLISDFEGREYERIEYTPYGEIWIERTCGGFKSLPFRFTGKELDPETGFYYFGARYLNPKTSIWISADPALDSYLPSAPSDNAARRANRNLPGQGGIFNPINLNLYHYAGNNPVRYVDPDGNYIFKVSNKIHQQDSTDKLGFGKDTIEKSGCVLTTFTRIASAIAGKNFKVSDANDMAKKLKLFCGETNDLMSAEQGAKLISALTGKRITYGSIDGAEDELIGKIKQLSEDPYSGYYITGRINAHTSDGSESFGHQININESEEDIYQPICDTSTRDRKDTGGDKYGYENLFRIYWFCVGE